MGRIHVTNERGVVVNCCDTQLGPQEIESVVAARGGLLRLVAACGGSFPAMVSATPIDMPDECCSAPTVTNDGLSAAWAAAESHKVAGNDSIASSPRDALHHYMRGLRSLQRMIDDSVVRCGSLEAVGVNERQALLLLTLVSNCCVCHLKLGSTEKELRTAVVMCDRVLAVVQRSLDTSELPASVLPARGKLLFRRCRLLCCLMDDFVDVSRAVDALDRDPSRPAMLVSDADISQLRQELQTKKQAADDNFRRSLKGAF